MSKVWDVTPATNFIQVFVAQTNYNLIGLRIRFRQIPVKLVETTDPLGTQDGLHYSIKPADDGDVSDEDEQHGRN